MREKINPGGQVAYKFGKRSMKNLNQAHPDLQKLFFEVIKHVDCSVICGHRSEREQNLLFYDGKSELKFPNSKHNASPSLAVDVVPWPVDWSDSKKFYYFSGIVHGIAAQLKIKIRWGGDWNSNNNLDDQKFNDLPHFELKLT